MTLDIFSPLNNFFPPFLPFFLTLLLIIVSLVLNLYVIQGGEAIKDFLF
jgi:hypothetical protein